MRLDLRDIIHVPGAVKPFSFSFDLSDMDFYGQKPVCEPVQVEGKVVNRAERVKTVEVRRMLATELQDEEDDEIILLDGSILDAGEIMTTEFILEMDTKNLCREDCRGICPGCGADLNTEPCKCKPDIDPRLSALASLLE